MINRRTFGALLAGAVAAPRSAWSQSVTAKTVFYAGVGPELSLFDIDVADAALHKRGTVTLPANVQYAWPHPSKRYLYVVSSDGGPGRRRRHARRQRVPHRSGLGRADAARRAAGAAVAPDPCQRRRPGEYLLTAYNNPSNVTVHRINGDGTLGEAVSQPAKPDAGIYAHQMLTTPGNQTAHPGGTRQRRRRRQAGGSGRAQGLRLQDRRADESRLDRAGGTGLGFGPRHLDFHPTQPWVYVSIERQNKLYVYALQSDGTLGRDPMFVATRSPIPATSSRAAGAAPIHVHPNGRFVYLTNRNQGEVESTARRSSTAARTTWRCSPSTGRPASRPDPDHRRPRHPPADLRHRSERASAGRGEHPAARGARRQPDQDADGRAHGLSRRRRRQARVRAQVRRRHRQGPAVLERHGHAGVVTLA